MIHRSLLFLCLLFFSQSYAQSLNRVELGLVAPRISNCTPVKDQSMSSTCWSFSSTSLLESELMKAGKGKMDLSEMFIARYSLKRKIARHLKLKGGNFFTPGGQFHDAIWVIRNMGMVPEEAYPGKRPGQLYHDHAELDTVLSRFAKDCVNKGLTELDQRQDNWVDSVLDHYLGPVPDEFVYKGTVYTPHSFLQRELELDPDDYLEITSYTHHPFYSTFVLEDKYNWTGDAYWNVPLSDFSAITNAALDQGYTVGWDGDAEDDQFDYFNAMAWLPGNIRDSTGERQSAFETQATLLNHMMHIVARTKDKNGNSWYYIKNSWGDASNPLGGFLFMREDYFKIRTLAIIVNKKALPAATRAKLGL